MFEHIKRNPNSNNKFEKFLKVNALELQRIRKNIEFPSLLIQSACDYIDKAIILLFEASNSSEILRNWTLLVEKKKAKYRKRIELEFEVLEESMYYENGEVVILKSNALKAIEKIREILKEN
jgi:hypothetical protein